MNRHLALPFRSVALCAMLLAGATPQQLQAPAQALSALPPGDFHFTGAWDCHGTFQGGKPHHASFSVEVILAGKWLELTETDLEPATGYLAKYLIGYDATQHRLVEFDANNFSAATYSSADGWQDHVLTMASPLASDPKAPYAANRFIYTTQRDTFTVDWQIAKDATLKWIPADHLLCERSSHA